MSDSPLVDGFKEAMAHRAGGVCIVALREDDDVHATTVTSLTSVSVDPPTVLLALGGNAQVLPFLTEGVRFVVSVLREDQKRIASVYADSFPVGASPFPSDGDPVVDDALATLTCIVSRVYDPVGARLVLGEVIATSLGRAGRPLIHFLRSYHRIASTP